MLTLYPIYTPPNAIYPRYFHRLITREETTYQYGKETVVKRHYVQGIVWHSMSEEFVPSKSFRKDVEIGFVVTDDLDAFLRRKMPKYRE